MVKLAYVLQLRKDMDRKEAMRYWREVHGPIAARTPGLRRYVQNQASASTDGDLRFDGIAELWFDTQADLDTALASPEWRATIADVPNFADLPNCWGAVVDEIPFL
jgi:uncharacterized protein (TIGR02118 family)